MSRPAFAMRVHRARRRLAAHLREQDAASLSSAGRADPVLALRESYLARMLAPLDLPLEPADV